ncbi:hypothetical protein [Alkalihalophilus marmarensis]|nr:hypothetical protein [Alkalihalophilus marmarensis]
MDKLISSLYESAYQSLADDDENALSSEYETFCSSVDAKEVEEYTKGWR